jgi:hypothetical protein
MGRVAQLILLVVVSVCVVFCVLCCLQNNPVVSSVTVSHIYIYLLTLNKKQNMKIMGRVARLILLVVVSVCVVFCVLCFLQNNPVFSSVTIFIQFCNNWCSYFDTTDGYLRFISTIGQTTVPFFLLGHILFRL